MIIRPISLSWHLAISLAMIAATTAVCFRVIPVNATTAGFAYLMVVLGISAVWGLPEAVIAAVAATLCYNFFFLPPVGQFTIADPQNWVALFAFLTTALVASNMSDRVKRQAIEARGHQRETEQLYALSRTILLTDPSQSIGFRVTQHISEIFGCRAVALYDANTGKISSGGDDDIPEIERKLKEVVLSGTSLDQRSGQVLVAPIILGGHPIGSLALKGVSISEGALQALLNLVAIALERVRMEESANRAEVARQSEEFKSTLLDAIAHEFKTPLTSIKAASTSMLLDRNLSPQSHELATIIDEESDRMSLLVTEAVRMSQIDAGKILLERESIDVSDLLHGVVRHFEPRTEGRQLNLQLAGELPRIWADRKLVSLALRQLIDNALKYSPPGSPIHISASLDDNHLVMRVRDCGPGIPERERERIFDKFYRRQASKATVPGTGLGLYIAREIMRTHGGNVWIAEEPGSGTEFRVSLPIQEESRRT